MDSWQAAEVFSPQRANLRMLTVGSSQIHFIPAEQGIAGDNIIRAIKGIAFKTGRGVEHGVDKNKLYRLPEPFSLKPQRRYQRQMSPRAVSAKGDPVFIHAQFVRILPDQICTSFRIVMCGGEGMLRRQPVLNRNHPAIAVAG